ncbi:MAG: hypothetical protein CBR30_03075 [Dictyoglomus sp. NZ13-RE01]|nr:MAG: hypothetical protein CBR30_03075 [Dictyoglomus sp. NZ13-RE01]
MRITTKVLIIIFLINFILVGGILFVLFTQLRGMLFSNFERLIEHYTIHLAETIYPNIKLGFNDKLAIDDKIKYTISFMPELMGITILDKNFNIVYSYNINESFPKYIYQSISSKITKYHDLKGHSYYLIIPMKLIDENLPYHLVSVSSTKNLEKNLGLTLFNIFFYVILAQILLSIVAFYLLRRDFLLPLEALTQYIKKPNPSIKEEPFFKENNEIGELSRTLVELHERLESIIKEQKSIIENRTYQLNILSDFLSGFNMAQSFEELISSTEKKFEKYFPKRLKDLVLINPWTKEIFYKRFSLISEEEMDILLEYFNTTTEIPSRLTKKDVDFLIPSFPEDHILSVLRRKNRIFGFVIIDISSLSEETIRVLISIKDHFTIALENILIYEHTKKLSITDHLTGLLNRRRLEEILSIEMKRAERFSHPLSIIFLDIDHFKLINDSYGHVIGDEFLRELSIFLIKNIRHTDYVGRFGGEEFILVLVETHIAGAKNVAEKIRRRWIEEKHVIEINEEKKIGTLSMGIAGYPEHSNDPFELIKYADIALYNAKKDRNKVSVFSKEFLKEFQ